LFDVGQDFAAWGIVSGFAFLLSATIIGASRKWSAAWGLAAFLMAWGVQAILQNLADLIQTSSTRDLVGRLGILFILLQPLTLWYAIGKLRDEGTDKPVWKKWAPWGFLAVLVWSAVALVLAILMPPLILSHGAWGILAPLAIDIPTFGSFALVLYLVSRFATAQTKTPFNGQGGEFSHELREKLFIGLWIPIVHLVCFNLTFNPLWGLSTPPSTGIFVVAALAMTLVGLRHLVRVQWRLSTMLWMAVPIVGAIVYVAWRGTLGIASGPSWIELIFSPGTFRLLALVPLWAHVKSVQSERAFRPASLAARREAIKGPVFAVAIPILMGAAVSFGRTQDTYAAIFALIGGLICVFWFFSTNFPGDVTPTEEMTTFLRHSLRLKNEVDAASIEEH
jgi:uncharacterized membrane protein